MQKKSAICNKTARLYCIHAFTLLRRVVTMRTVCSLDIKFFRVTFLYIRIINNIINTRRGKDDGALYKLNEQYCDFSREGRRGGSEEKGEWGNSRAIKTLAGICPWISGLVRDSHSRISFGGTDEWSIHMLAHTCLGGALSLARSRVRDLCDFVGLERENDVNTHTFYFSLIKVYMWKNTHKTYRAVKFWYRTKLVVKFLSFFCPFFFRNEEEPIARFFQRNSETVNRPERYLSLRYRVLRISADDTWPDCQFVPRSERWFA